MGKKVEEEVVKKYTHGAETVMWTLVEVWVCLEERENRNKKKEKKKRKSIICALVNG